MKHLLTTILLTLLIALPHDLCAQYNRNYIYWVGQQCMVDNNYREAIDVLNVLLRHDDKDFDAYFLRGIAKYNCANQRKGYANGRRHAQICFAQNVKNDKY